MPQSQPPSRDEPQGPERVVRAPNRLRLPEGVFDIAPDAILVVGADGNIRDANVRTQEMFGYARQELIGLPVEALIPQHLGAGHLAHRKAYSRDSRQRPMGAGLNLMALRKDGSELPVDIMLKPVTTEDGPVVLAFVRDISEQRRMAEERATSDALLRAIVDSVQEYAVFMLDPEGTVMSWNAGAERLMGYSTSEAIGKPYSSFFLQEEADRGKPAELLRLAAERTRVEQDAWCVRRDGNRFWAETVLQSVCDNTGSVIGFSRLIKDVSERKKVSDSVMLRLSGALLSTQDEHSLLGVIFATLQDLIPHDCATLGILEQANDTMRVRFLGIEKGELRRGDIVNSLAGTPAEEVYRTGMPALIPDLKSSSYRPGSLDHLIRLGMQSACCVPLSFDGIRFGSLAVASRSLNGFTANDASILMKVVGQVAAAVQNAQLLQQITDTRDKLSWEKRYLEEEINLQNNFEDIVGSSEGLRDVLRQVETVATTNATVLIEGETGTGKELLARAVHRLSQRKEHTFIKLNCAAISAGLIESELFGHEKGAFTGAIMRKIGKLELAHNGTLFLDEIGELPLELQPKLLRALQEREIERLGGNLTVSVNLRLIAATNRDLQTMVDQGKFRRDLYYRLKVFPLTAPPLRERSGDIPALVQHFVAVHSRKLGKRIESIPAEIMQAFQRFSWPGNVRELENFLERAVILTRGKELYVPLHELRAGWVRELAPGHEPATLADAEREHILHVLRETSGQIGGADGAASRLGLKRTTLNSKLKKLGVQRGDYISPL